MGLTSDLPDLCEPLIVSLRSDVRRESDPETDPWQVAVNDSDEVVSNHQNREDAIEAAKSIAVEEEYPGVIITDDQVDFEEFWVNDNYWEKRLLPPVP